LALCRALASLGHASGREAEFEEAQQPLLDHCDDIVANLNVALSRFYR
jgi:hypothetical protein